MEEKKKKKYTPSPEQKRKYAETQRQRIANMTPEEQAARKARLKASHDKRMQDPVKREAEKANKKAYVARRLAENPNWLKEKYLEGATRKKEKAARLATTVKDGERLCHYCCRVLPETEFPVTRTGDRSIMCSKCFSEVTGTFNPYTLAYWNAVANRTNNRVRRRTKSSTEEISFEPLTGEQLYKMFIEQQYKCPYCGTQLHGLNITVDHTTALTKGGAHSIDNVRIICRSCNGAKFQMSEDAYRTLLELVLSFNP